MATNGPKGKGRRGAVRKRAQVRNPKSKRWTKVHGKSRKFTDQKADRKPFKGVRKHKKRA